MHLVELWKNHDEIYHNQPIRTKEKIAWNQSEIKGETNKLLKARENASGQFAIGSSFASDWGQVIAIS